MNIIWCKVYLCIILCVIPIVYVFQGSVTTSPPCIHAVVESSVDGVKVDVNEARRRQLAKRQREKRGRGLSLVAGEIVEKFNKVAVSKQKVQAKEQVSN